MSLTDSLLEISFLSSDVAFFPGRFCTELEFAGANPIFAYNMLQGHLLPMVPKGVLVVGMLYWNLPTSYGSLPPDPRQRRVVRVGLPQQLLVLAGGLVVPEGHGDSAARVLALVLARNCAAAAGRRGEGEADVLRGGAPAALVVRPAAIARHARGKELRSGRAKKRTF